MLILWCCKSAAIWAMHVGHLAVQFICDFIIEKWNGPWLSCRRYTSHPTSLAYSTTLLSTVAGGHWLWCGQMALGTPAFKWFNYFPFLSFPFLFLYFSTCCFVENVLQPGRVRWSLLYNLVVSAKAQLQSLKGL